MLDADEVEAIRALSLQSLQSLEDDPGSKVIHELRRRQLEYGLLSLVRRFARCHIPRRVREQCHELVVFLLRKRVVLVVVTLCAADRAPQERRLGRE